jgi:hypothetical protein
MRRPNAAILLRAKRSVKVEDFVSQQHENFLSD